MLDFHTHYDNLKVSRNAPPEVIRAAYKTLTQKYHPDKNFGKDTGRIMQLINESYAVLSDSKRRSAHDLWIESEKRKRFNEQLQKIESTAKARAHAEQTRRSAPEPDLKQPKANYSTPQKNSSLHYILVILTLPFKILAHTLRNLFRYSLILLFTLLIFSLFAKKDTNMAYNNPKVRSPLQQDIASSARQNHKPSLNQPIIAKCIPMNSAPNGSRWPATASYLNWEKTSKTKSHSNILIDNTQNSSAIYIKLKDKFGFKSLRTAYIPAYRFFMMSKIDTGTYQIFYKDLSSGCNSKSNTFTLNESNIKNQAHFTRATIITHKIDSENSNYARVADENF